MKKSLKNKLEKAGNFGINLATNLGLAWGALEGIEQLDKLDYSTATQALAAAGAGIGIYSLNKSGAIKKFSKKINETARKFKGKAAPWVRNAILAAYLGASIYGVGTNAIDVYRDFSKTKEEVVALKVVKRTAPKSLDTHVGNYQTIQLTKNIPALVVECFFGSNKNDLAYFQIKENREKFCNHLASGIEKYVSSNPKREIITIAGGHGENYPGACFGENGEIHESKFTKEMSKYIADNLEKKRYEVNYLWYMGPFDSKKGQQKRLNEYTQMANKYSGKSVYVEIHADASRPSVAGSRVYGPRPKNKNPESHKFGKIVLNEINKSW